MGEDKKKKKKKKKKDKKKVKFEDETPEGEPELDEEGNPIPQFDEDGNPIPTAGEDGAEKKKSRWGGLFSAFASKLFCVGAPDEEQANATIIIEEDPEMAFDEVTGTDDAPEARSPKSRKSVNEFSVLSMPSNVEGAPSARWQQVSCLNENAWLDVAQKEGIQMAGKSVDGSPWFAARCTFRGGVHPCKAGPSLCDPKAFIEVTHQKDAVKLYGKDVEVLFASNPYELRWKKKKRSTNMVAAVVAGMDAQGHFLRASQGLDFQPASAAKPLWIARSFYKGCVEVGKAGPHLQNGNVAYFSIGGREVALKDFEVLVAVPLDGPAEGENEDDWDPGYGPQLTLPFN